MLFCIRSNVFYFFFFWQYWSNNLGSYITPPSPFCFSFQIGSHGFFCLGLAADCDPPTYVSQVVVIIAEITKSSLFIEMGLLLTFLPGLASNYNPADLHLLNILCLQT
jgi:hypothetical protein